jgi:tripartite-type tricarboxylate transporter receptor subunit TctC
LKTRIAALRVRRPDFSLRACAGRRRIPTIDEQSTSAIRKKKAPHRDWNVMRRSVRRLGSILLAVGLVACAAPALAQAQYPAKPIKIIVPYAPGGLTDVVARHYAEQVRKIVGQAVVVENKPGASGILAIEEMARARPDGHTIMIGNISTNGLTPVLLRKKMSIDYDKDVQIVARLADVPVFFLATTTDFAPKTFAEFIAYAKQNPGKVRYGSAGAGSYQQINTEVLAKRAGIELSHIPFRDGGSGILRDLGNGDIHVTWFNITNPVGMMKAGRVRPLAIAAPQRLPDYPDVPTIAEVGFPGIKAVQWVAAYAPAGVPSDIIETLHAAFAKAVKVPELADAFQKGGMIAPPPGTLADARAWIRDEMAMWKQVTDELNLRLDD